jgi:hypothetical protein
MRYYCVPDCFMAVVVRIECAPQRYKCACPHSKDYFVTVGLHVLLQSSNVLL